MTNSLGGFSVWRLNLLSRRQYASLRAQRDAVARLRLEVAERQKAEREARDSQERFRRLIELSPDAVVVHKNGLLLYANRAALTMTGISPQTDIHGHNLLEFVCQDNQEEMSKHLDQWRQGSVENKTDDVTLVRDDGREVACEIISGLTTYDGQAAVQTVIRDISHRKNMEADLRRMATTDHLTQLHNRRNYLELSRGEVERARRYGRPLSVMVLDLDNFKNVNDCHGHAAGDEVLRRTAQVCRDQLRECDFMGRLGGEEFGVTLPETELEMAQKVADRLRVAVSEIRLDLESGLVSLTVSIGVAQCDLENESLDDVLLRADRAMYTAKEAGRNQVCYARAASSQQIS
jgi:diguanylate cyclase (GGDEF)-like protein/PAS domain S-box-containing protein